MNPASKPRSTLQVIAVFEAVKGLAAFAGLIGILDLLHHDVRAIEAAGLWFHKAWAEYLGAFSGGIYIPFELVHWAHEPTWINAGLVALNGVIVGYLIHAGWLRLTQKKRYLPA